VCWVVWEYVRVAETELAGLFTIESSPMTLCLQLSGFEWLNFVHVTLQSMLSAAEMFGGMHSAIAMTGNILHGSCLSDGGC